MGVTLERVQNKFACIIGELCNEPYVLSQFAIWVDLRIAEYKANGAISLDCTGDNPHPTWLKGMNPPKSTTPNQSLNQSGSSRRHGRFDSLGNPTSATESCGLSFDSGEYEIVEVKEEPPDFPTCTSFKSHGRLSPTRKRISENQDFLESDNSVFPTSAPKSRRLSAASEYTGISTVGQDTVSNQSFMSVIGLTDHTAHSVDNLNLPSDEKSPFSKFDQSKGSNQGNVSFDDVTIHPSVSTDEGDDETSANRDGTESEVKQTPSGKADSCEASQLQGTDQISYGGLSVSREKIPSKALGTTSRKEFGRDRTAKPGVVTPFYSLPQTGGKLAESVNQNMKSIIKAFRKWLWLNHNEQRPVEDVPPVQLDIYLAEYYTTVKRKNGEEFSPRTFSTLKERLQKHLKVHGYPLSISRSLEFVNSQEAFRRKLRQLVHLQTLECATDN